jgi:hypothetical protein
MNQNLFDQLIKLPLPCLGTLLIAAAFFTPVITPVSIQYLLYGVGASILAAAGVHISGIGGNPPADGGGVVKA